MGRAMGARDIAAIDGTAAARSATPILTIPAKIRTTSINGSTQILVIAAEPLTFLPSPIPLRAAAPSADFYANASSINAATPKDTRGHTVPNPRTPNKPSNQSVSRRRSSGGVRSLRKSSVGGDGRNGGRNT